jgi:DNA-binding SARP family transcriptional activator
MMSTLRFSLFGKFSVCRSGEVLTARYTPKMQELLSYLLLYHNRSHSRDTLATLLFGDTTTCLAKKHLRQILWQVQPLLDEQTEMASCHILQSEPGWVQFNLGPQLWLDVAMFEEAYSIMIDKSQSDLDSREVECLENAINLYTADFLEGWYHDWCVYERERLQNMYLMILDRLMDYWEARHEFLRALAYGTRILQIDHARERTHRQIMRLQYQAGDRTAALRQYLRCRLALSEELGVEPAQATQSLYEQIRSDRLDQPRSTDSAASANVNLPHRGQPGGLDDILRSLVTTLSDTQRVIGSDIRLLEDALNLHQ